MYFYNCRSLESQNKLLCEQNHKILAKSDELIEALRISIQHNSNLNRTLYQPMPGFPMKTIEEFNNFSIDSNNETILTMVNFFLIS